MTTDFDNEERFENILAEHKRYEKRYQKKLIERQKKQAPVVKIEPVRQFAKIVNIGIKPATTKAA